MILTSPVFFISHYALNEFPNVINSGMPRTSYEIAENCPKEFHSVAARSRVLLVFRIRQGKIVANPPQTSSQSAVLHLQGLVDLICRGEPRYGMDTEQGFSPHTSYNSYEDLQQQCLWSNELFVAFSPRSKRCE